LRDLMVNRSVELLGSAAAKRTVRQERQLIPRAVLGHAAQQRGVLPHAQLHLNRVDVGNAPGSFDLTYNFLAMATSKPSKGPSCKS